MKERTRQWGIGRIPAIALFALALVLAGSRAFAAGTAPVTVKWKTQALVHITLTPNYASGFGQIKATIGTQPAPTHGPGATGIGTGSVDFGNVVGGSNYIYRYAAHLHVSSNSTTGVNVYGEGAVNFTNTTDSTTYPISTSIYYLNSTSGSPADTNTGFSAAVPFQLTSGAVTGGGPSSPPSIAYTVYPAPISTSTLGTTDFYYDYQMHVPLAATSGAYYCWIVYTVIAS